MTRACILALAVAGCLAPVAAEAQTRVSTFRSFPKAAFRGPHRGMVSSRSRSDSFTTVRSARGQFGFRGFQAAPLFGGGGFGAVGYGYGYEQNLLYRLGRIPVPPYYALHPPVYYSQPIPRTYGESPYARWPAIESPYDLEVKPAAMINPYYEKPAEKASQDAKEASLKQPRTVSQTRFILNPFYKPPRALAQSELRPQ